MSLIRFRTVPDFSILLGVLGVMFIYLGIPHGVCGVSTNVDSQETEMTFQSMGAGTGKTEDGSEYSFAWVKSSDGVLISARTERRRSAARARSVLRRTLRGAETVEPSPKMNNRGRQVGQRVIARFDSQNQAKTRYVVLWTDGSDFHYLESLSLPHLLAYEKKYP